MSVPIFLWFISAKIVPSYVPTYGTWLVIVSGNHSHFMVIIYVVKL